ncbi:PACS2 [Acanthosepion pharaonis]|uniref:PACS2 n=1 Tax=Acanthosepion pharaonis TaxID=158019 RepID=A0A812CLW0_ACAPH|nr:PACS2 [Sepia pharaonis]
MRKYKWYCVLEVERVKVTLPRRCSTKTALFDLGYNTFPQLLKHICTLPFFFLILLLCPLSLCPATLAYDYLPVFFFFYHHHHIKCVVKKTLLFLRLFLSLLLLPNPFDWCFSNLGMLPLSFSQAISFSSLSSLLFSFSLSPCSFPSLSLLALFLLSLSLLFSFSLSPCPFPSLSLLALFLLSLLALFLLSLLALFLLSLSPCPFPSLSLSSSPFSLSLLFALPFSCFSPSLSVLQRNFKQKFIALLRRFKVSEEALDSEADHELVDPDHNPPDIEDLLDFEDLSDSGPELDTLSVISTPKPQLRPFFTARSNFNEISDVPKGSPVKCVTDDNLKRTDSDSHAEHASQDIEIHPTSSTSSYHDGHVADQRSELAPNQKASPQHKPSAFPRERSFSYRERQKKKNKLEDRRNSTGQVEQVPRKVLLDQLSSLGGNSEDKLPDCFLMVNTAEWQGQFLIQKCQDKPLKLISTCTAADMKAVISFLVTRIQKFCNSNSKSPSPIKIGVAGNDGYINSILRPYVDQFSVKSPDWQSYVRFLVIPFGASSIGKYLANIDSVYCSLFMDNSWRETFEKSENQKLDSQEIFNRISKYLSSANYLLPIPIGEAMVTYKGRNTDEESTQIFIPFISEVKIGSPDYLNASVDIDESPPCTTTVSGSPPSQAGPVEKTKEGHTPPNSPNVSLMSPSQSQQSVPASAALPFLTATTQSSEYMELQVEYWTLTSKTETGDKDRINKKESSKCSLKTAFRSLHVYRLPPTPSETPVSAGFCMGVVTKEKKQKIMRIGKKSKDPESKSQVIEGISRLICTSKNHNYTLKVVVDGVEWTGVKFFQLSSQWQTHIKNFPVVIFSYQEPHMYSSAVYSVSTTSVVSSSLLCQCPPSLPLSFPKEYPYSSPLADKWFGYCILMELERKTKSH